MKKLIFISLVFLFACVEKPTCWTCKTWNDVQNPSDTDPIVTIFEGKTDAEIAEYIKNNTRVDTINGMYIYVKETRCTKE